jgi:uncharacterized protein (DUF1330 family)
MQVENAVTPRGEQLQALLAAGGDGPIVMLNLLKFRETSAYDDPEEAPVSGREAYGRYGERMLAFVTSRGGRVLFSGRADALVIGEVGELWDAVALVEYPSRAVFVEVATAPEVAQFHHHRKAGLAGQLLIQLTEGLPR